MIAKCVALPMRIPGLNPYTAFVSDNAQGRHESVYQIAELLIEPVSCSASCFLVRNLGSNPIAQMFLVFASELRPPTQMGK
jgi:hypothetical protein